MKKLLSTFTIASALLLTGCATQTAVMKPNAKIVKTYENSEHFFVGGIAQTKQINATEICGGADKVVAVESKLSGLNVVVASAASIVGAFVGLPSVYSPRTSKVHCSR